MAAGATELFRMVAEQNDMDEFLRSTQLSPELRSALKGVKEAAGDSYDNRLRQLAEVAVSMLLRALRMAPRQALKQNIDRVQVALVSVGKLSPGDPRVIKLHQLHLLRVRGNRGSHAQTGGGVDAADEPNMAVTSAEYAELGSVCRQVARATQEICNDLGRQRARHETQQRGAGVAARLGSPERALGALRRGAESVCPLLGALFLSVTGAGLNCPQPGVTAQPY
eukprot:TRINITY_DN15759_c0_g1_i1.p2 TRINITY_DN15759_c0_g1~~TRINITY_DN15759_c0_g1_i1.p2  ORF type:complete len:247 (+),score=82.38 TRINITY_DN15759_c0_g1_i1:72-743(+)